MGKDPSPRLAKDPMAAFCGSMYWLDEKNRCIDAPDSVTPAELAKARFGIPCRMFKGAAVGACRQIPGAKMTCVKTQFHVIGEYVPIISPPPESNQAMVRVSNGQPDIRFRGKYWPWGCVITVQYNAGAISLSQLLNLFRTAGFGCGIGEWRPSAPESATGELGRFHIARTETEFSEFQKMVTGN